MMKKLLALVLCLCFALGGCAQGEAAERGQDEGGASPAPAPVAAEGFEQLALALAELPEIPEEPDEEAFYRQASCISSSGTLQTLWDEFYAKQNAYYEALSGLRGDGVDAALTPSFAEYTLRTARQLFENAAERNVVYSPANLYLALCMLVETTDGESRAQLLDLLGLENVEQARKAANSLFRSLYSNGATGKTLPANSLWLNERFNYHEATVSTLANDYYASAFRAAMGDKTTDDAIHEWINENTNGLLADAANALKTTPDTLLMLVSTLYFKGTWSDQFEEFATNEDVFTAADGTEQTISFMHKAENGNYYRGNRFTAASLPFRDGTSMWFLLPDEGAELSGVWQLFQDLPRLAVDTADGCYETIDFASLAQPGYADIHWSVPKFDVDSDLDLIPTLKALGVTDIFADGADFSPLTDLDALVSAVEHAARVKVDEEGCEAAAFTAVTMEATSALVEPLPVVEMNLDRPFGFLITGADGLPLFMAVVNTMR